MGFVKYDRNLKVIAVKLSLRGQTLAEINQTIDKKVSHESLRRWKQLYERTCDVVCDPALYLDCGRPLAFTTEESEFVMAALDAEPTLYLDEIQSHIEAMTGTRHPHSTISEQLRVCLLMTKKKARTVHPAQCQSQRAAYTIKIGPYPPHFLVFLGESTGLPNR
jgi:hypothetical protein